ncbi:MAG: alpha/beta hydrolase, partial [Oscillospiraceae bacterium]
MNNRAYIHVVPGADTAIVFLHGIVGTPDHFDVFLPLVPADWSVFNLLLDGHGGGVEDFAHTSMKKWEEQVSSLLDSLCGEYESIFICAHSMGTLFAIDGAIAHPDRVRELMLLGVPMRARLGGTAVKNSLRVVFGRVPEDDPVAQATKAACGVKTDRRLWKYAGWVPRYLELFAKIKETRAALPGLRVPCRAYQSAHDELVSPWAYTFLREQKNVESF